MSEPSDLPDIFAPDGTIDPDKLRAHQQTGVTTTGTSAETCDQWRRELPEGATTAEIAVREEIHRATVAKHASGRCCCDGEVDPLTYTDRVSDRRGAWEVQE